MSGYRTERLKMNASNFARMVSVFTLLSTSACSSISTGIRDVVLDRLAVDTARTVEMAEKYQSKEVAQCAKFLQLATAGVKELADEPTAGIFSMAFKAALLRRMGTTFEDTFTAECGSVAARILLELGRRAPIPGVN